VAVVPTAPTAPWAAWCADNGVRLIHIHCEIYKEKNPVNNTIASRVLEVGRDLAPAEFYDRLVTLTTGSDRIGRCLPAQLLIDPEAHPIFLHCMNGAEVTGLLVMCLRKLQMWSQTFALIEFSRSAERPPRKAWAEEYMSAHADNASLGGLAADAGRFARASLRRTRPTLWTSLAARSRCPRGCRGGYGKASRWPGGTPRLSWWYGSACRRLIARQGGPHEGRMYRERRGARDSMRRPATRPRMTASRNSWSAKTSSAK